MVELLQIVHVYGKIPVRNPGSIDRDHFDLDHFLTLNTASGTNSFGSSCEDDITFLLSRSGFSQRSGTLMSFKRRRIFAQI